MDAEAVLREFVARVARRAPIDEIGALLHDDIVQVEMPNRLSPSGARRDRAAMLDGARRGRQVLSGETYDVRNVVVRGDHVAAEVAWTGTLAVPLGELPIGHVLRASLAMFAEIRGGQIVGLRNYDSYEP